MKKILTLLLFVCALCAQAQVARPKLVVGLVVDQMRWDYLYYYYDLYGEGGLKRILREGYSCANTHINYTPTVTSIGHSAVYTGAVPSVSGIAGNNFYMNGQSVYCCQDSAVQSVGSKSPKGQMSPHRLRVSTIGDELRLSNDYQSRVFGVALKDRASILPAGHTANAAYWWDSSVGHFVSSTFYMSELPQWVQDFNKANHTKPKYNLKGSTEGVTMTFKMAEALLQNEKLGQGDVTDMLTVSISSTDAIGHQYSTRGKENKAVWLQLDKDLTTFLQALDNAVGKGNYLLFLTADHGAAHNYNQLRAHKYPSGSWDYDQATIDLNNYLKGKFGLTMNPVLPEDNYQFTFDPAVWSTTSTSKETIIDAAVEWLKQNPEYLYVVNNEKINQASIPDPIKERLVNGYCRGRSGEISVVTRPQYFGGKFDPNYGGTSHGQPYVYDTHIPCVYMGWNVPHGETTAETHITDIAATICAMLHIQMPNGCYGTPTTFK